MLLQPRTWRHLLNPFRPSWGEPYVELAARMKAAIDDVRAILGHRSFETALIYYRRHNQRAAAERLSATLAGQRRKTRTKALSQLMAPELRRRRRRGA